MRSKDPYDWSLEDYQVAGKNERWIIAYLAITVLIMLLSISLLVDPSRRREGETTWQQGENQSPSRSPSH